MHQGQEQTVRCLIQWDDSHRADLSSRRCVLFLGLLCHKMSLLHVMSFHSNLLTNIIILKISSCFLAGLRLLVTSFNMTNKNRLPGIFCWTKWDHRDLSETLGLGGETSPAAEVSTV